MAKICLLKADILHMNLVFKDVTLPAIESIMDDLQHWYHNLPQEIRLEASTREDLTLETKRTILHVHLLHLGAMMLLHRRVATQLVQAEMAGAYSGIMETPLAETVLRESAEAVLAAKTSSRILKLLLDDNGVFKRCWLVMQVPNSV
jgi:hypothetical protein